MSTTPVDVIVVGAGPVGLVAASELTRRGIRVRVIDRLGAPTTQSRAIGVHGRSMDMFDRMGIAEQLIATGIKTLAFQMYSGHKPLSRIPLDSVDVAFPFMLTTAQTETERILGQHLHSLGGAVERSVELVGLSQDSTAVALTLRHPDGSIEQATTSWVVGADGAGSIVRELVGTKLEGSFGRWQWVVADVDADHHLDVHCAYNFLSADGPVVAMPMRGGRMRFLAQVHAPATTADAEPTLDELQEIIDRRVGGIRLLRSHWLSYFQIHSAQVPQYIFGRVFLVGDAGHIHSPAGGQGMNTGMQDAFNLAWKLAAVIHGEAGDFLLDSYNAERHPIAQGVLRLSERITRMWQLSGPARRVRDVLLGQLSHIAPARRAMVDDIAEVNLNYRHSPVAVGDRPRGAKVAAGQHLPYVRDPAVYKQLRATFGPDNLCHTVITVASEHSAPTAGGEGRLRVLVARDNTPEPGYDTVIADPRQALAERVGLQNGGRLVVRPDGYIGAITTLEDTTAIDDYFARIAS